MTTTIDRAEINRRNAARSTGPRTPEGKARSRFNAVKHGCRARLPILPGEDPEAYQHRLDAWVGKFARATPSSSTWSSAPSTSPGSSTAPTAPRSPDSPTRPTSEADRLAEEVAKLGAELFRVPAGPIGATPTELGGDRADRSSPGRSTRSIAATPPAWSPRWRPPRRAATGCWAEWAALGKLLDDGRNWQAIDRLRAIRLLGKQPLDVVADEQVLTIYLACHAMDPDGPDVVRRAVERPAPPRDGRPTRERLAARFAAARAERAPRDAAEGRAALRAIVAAAVARVEALREVRAAAEAAEHGGHLGPAVATTPGRSVEWLRQAPGDVQPGAVPDVRRAAQGPPGFRRRPAGGRAGRGAAGSRRDVSRLSREARGSPQLSRPPSPAGQRAGTRLASEGIPGQARGRPRAGSPRVVRPSPADRPGAGRSRDDRPRRCPERDERSQCPGRRGPGRDERSNRPAGAAARAVPGWFAAAPALLALLCSASFGAMGAGVGPDPSLQMHRDATKSALRSPGDGVTGSGPTATLAARPIRWCSPPVAPAFR